MKNSKQPATIWISIGNERKRILSEEDTEQLGRLKNNIEEVLSWVYGTVDVKRCLTSFSFNNTAIAVARALKYSYEDCLFKEYGTLRSNKEVVLAKDPQVIFKDIIDRAHTNNAPVAVVFAHSDMTSIMTEVAYMKIMKRQSFDNFECGTALCVIPRSRSIVWITKNSVIPIS